jgi:ornithine cyclodeaminase/alanine dehydrogenase-like protein (mu-crystallin family)
MVLLINNEEVAQLLTVENVMRALEEAYLEVDRGLAANRPRTFTMTPTKQGRFIANTHEGILSTQGVYSIRIVTHSRRGHPSPESLGYFHAPTNVSLDLLYDVENGTLLAIIQDGYLQKMRVQATNAIAARYMAKKNARTMALIGSGWQASATIEAVRFVRPIQKVRVYSRSPENRKRFVEKMCMLHSEVGIKDFDSAEETVSGADVVVAATNSKVPVCKGEWIEKGMHLTGVLQNEFDLEAYKKADYIVIFNRLHGRDYTLNRGPGEEPRQTPAQAPLLRDAPEIIDLVSGKVPGRLNDEQITIFANGGHGWGLDGGPGYGIQFTAVSKLVYDLAKEKGLGRKLPLEWFEQNVNS